MTEQIGIVRSRGDEVRRGDQRRFCVDLINAGVVAGIETNEQIGIAILRQLLQQFTESDRTRFRRSAAGAGQAGQGIFFFQHKIFVESWIMIKSKISGQIITKYLAIYATFKMRIYSRRCNLDRVWNPVRVSSHSSKNRNTQRKISLFEQVFFLTGLFTAEQMAVEDGHGQPKFIADLTMQACGKKSLVVVISK